jgi:predicted nucleic acid-binding protein
LPESARDARGWEPGREFGPGFADALHLASAGNARRFATLDRKLARQASRMAMLETVSL